jgi:hypothetical protein
VAVEKLNFKEFAKIALRQDALQTTFSTRVDIFYTQICLLIPIVSTFSTDTPGYVNQRVKLEFTADCEIQVPPNEGHCPPESVRHNPC